MALRIDVDGSAQHVQGPLTLEQMQGIVGGSIQVVYLSSHGGVRYALVVDEEGLLRDVPAINVLATRLAQQQIVGTALLVKITAEGTDEEAWN